MTRGIKMKVLVTGAAGYMGKNVVSELIKRGHAVLAVDRNRDRIDKRAEILDVDIFSENASIFEEVGSPDLCIHLAWRDGFVHNAPSHIEDLSKHFIFSWNFVLFIYSF